MKHGFSLSTLFHTLGPNTLSCDEIFIALEYKALLSKYKVDLKMWEDGVKKEYDLEQKAKAILAQGKAISKILSDDLRILIN